MERAVSGLPSGTLQHLQGRWEGLGYVGELHSL